MLNGFYHIGNYSGNLLDYHRESLKMTRYHKNIFFPDLKDLPAIVNKLNSLKWKLSFHSFDRLLEKSKDIESIGYFIKNLILNEENIFEYYKDNTGIFKVVFRINFDKERDLILVLNTDKNIVTVYYNNVADNHKTLDKEIYSLI